MPLLEAAGLTVSERLQELAERESELQTALKQLREENGRLLSEAVGRAAALLKLSADLLLADRSERRR